MAVRNSLRYICQEAFILSKLPKEVIKIIVIIKAPTDAMSNTSVSVAEKFYEIYSCLLDDIKIIEVDEEGNLNEIG